MSTLPEQESTEEEQLAILQEQAVSDAKAYLEGLPGFQLDWYDLFVDEKGNIDSERLADSMLGNS